MSCPSEIADVVLKILKVGIMRIRRLGWAHEAERCAVEADHIHNLPDLLSAYSPDRLRYYWEAERISFIQQSSPVECAGFEPLWAKLGQHIGRLLEQTTP
jgi:hypothetical protein